MNVKEIENIARLIREEEPKENNLPATFGFSQSDETSIIRFINSKRTIVIFDLENINQFSVCENAVMDEEINIDYEIEILNKTKLFFDKELKRIKKKLSERQVIKNEKV